MMPQAEKEQPYEGTKEMLHEESVCRTIIEGI